MVTSGHIHIHRAGKIALIALVGLIAAVLLLVIAVNVLIKGDFIANQLGKRLDREFAIEGPMTIDWSWNEARIHAQKISLANAPGYAEPSMLEIADARLRIKLWPLLWGKIELPDLALSKPRLVLEKSKDGKNWDMPMFSEGSKVSGAVVPDNRREVPVIEYLRIDDGLLIYRDREKEMDLELALNTVTGESGDEKSTTTIKGHGTMQGKKFTVEAQGGSIRRLRNSEKAFPLDLKVIMGGTNLTFKGTLDDPIKRKGIDGLLTIKGGNMADLFYLTLLPLPPTPPYNLSGQLKKDTDVWAYRGFKGMVGDSDLRGNLSYDTGGERGYMKANLVSNNTDIDDLGGFIGYAPSGKRGETATLEQKRKAAQEAASPRLLPDTKLSVKRLRATDMDVTLNIAKLRAPKLPFRGMDLHFNLKQGLLKVDPMRLTLADGNIQGRLTVNARQDVPDVDMNLNFAKLQLRRFFEGTRFAASTQGDIGGNIALRGKGLSLARAFGSSNGRVTAIIPKGTMSLLLIEAADIDIAEAVPLLLGKEKKTEIRCGVADFRVKNGLLRSQVFILDTKDTHLKGDVTVNLKNERLNARFNAQPKDGSALSLQAPIVITGRLKDLQVGLDVAAAGTRGAIAGVLGAALGPLAAIVPFLSPAEGKDANCRALIAHVRG